MISKFFINRPIVAMVIAIITVLGGLVAMYGLPVAQFPEIIPPQIIVSTTYTGADSATIEQSVATPIEQQMSGVDNMLYMQSTNASDGTMALTVTFAVGTDPNLDQVNVQNRVAQAQPNLPTDVSQFGLTLLKSTGLPTLVIPIFSPNQTHDSLFLANYANININDALYRVPGVGQVRLFGASDYAMRVWVKPDLLAKFGLTVPDLVNAVQQQSTVNPAGQLGAAPAPPGQEMTYTVRAQGRLQTPEEFGEIVVRSNPDGSAVRMKDVARIEMGALNYQQVSRFNGRPAGIIAVFPLLGFSINTLSLFGLVLAIGLVVDDAIVVVEAVEHHIEEGMTPRDATLRAMQEVSGPVISIALILASVFIPVAFISGIQGLLNKQFAVTIAISVLISAFNALTLSPALAAMLLRPRKAASGPLGRFFGAFNRGFARATGVYVNVSHALIRKALVGVLILAAFALADGIIGRRIPTSFLPEEDYGYLLLNVQLPDAASLQRTDQVARKIEQFRARLRKSHTARMAKIIRHVTVRLRAIAPNPL